MVRILAMLGLVLASPAVAGDRPTPFLLSVPATSAEPLKSDAEVQFVSNGYWLSGENCVVTRSSGNAAADKQACETVIFRASVKPKKAIAPVWIPEPILGNFVAPTSRSSHPAVTTDDYPSASLNRGEQGTVVLRVIVDADGMLSDCNIASSSGFDRLDNAAKLKVCRRLKVKPATLDGVPIASINFTHVAFYAGE